MPGKYHNTYLPKKMHNRVCAPNLKQPHLEVVESQLKLIDLGAVIVQILTQLRQSLFQRLSNKNFNNI